MNIRSKARWKAALILSLVSLMLTSCSLLPSNLTAAAQSAAEGTVTISREEYERLKKFEELDMLLTMTETYYYEEPDVDAMIDNAKRGLLYALGDPYTYYYDPEQYAKMWEDDEGEYAGIGIQIMSSYETLMCTVSRVFQGSPAQAVGLHKGDMLIKVEDIDVTAYTLQEAVDIMRGEPGEPVYVQVQRGEELLDFNITRARIEVDWVNGMMLDDDIGYIALYEFAGDCALRFHEKYVELKSLGMKGLIIDIRDNPGGWVDDSAKLADIFLDEGTVAYLEYRDGSRDYYTTQDGSDDIPLVLLINEGSASSSEVLAGAMKDRDRATLVGVKSFGKGVVQFVLPVGNNGAGMQITAAQYYTPDGNTVHKVGIEPDVLIELPEGDKGMYELGDMNDAQLKKAFDVMRQTLYGQMDMAS